MVATSFIPARHALDTSIYGGALEMDLAWNVRANAVTEARVVPGELSPYFPIYNVCSLSICVHVGFTLR
jgi:hypothetical protein